MTDTIFEGDQPSQQAEDKPAEQPSLSYVGEGRKYGTVDELDKAYAHAELHLKKLEAENAELRKRTEQAKSIDAVLEKLEASNRPVETPTEEREPSKALTEDDVLRLMEHKSALEQQNKNAQTVVSSLKERFGDKAEEVFMSRSKELGLDLNQLARVSPTAVLEFFPKQPSTPQPSPSGQQGVSNPGTSYGTYEFWKEQYKEGKISREGMLRNQHKSLAAMGPEAFYKR